MFGFCNSLNYPPFLFVWEGLSWNYVDQTGPEFRDPFAFAEIKGLLYFAQLSLSVLTRELRVLSFKVFYSVSPCSSDWLQTL